MNYIDTHSHLYFPDFDADRDAVLSRMRTEQVVTIAVGTSLETSKKAVALSEAHPTQVLGATIGVHPTRADELFEVGEYETLLTRGVVLGIGECGFDYFRNPKEEAYQKQKIVFEAQIECALTHNLPLMLHVRPSKKTNDAHDDALAILQSYARTYGERVRGTAHFFTGSLESARAYWDLGFCTSFPGVITFAPETHEVVRSAPEALILSETDAPYAAPVPFRGGRAEPTHVVHVVQKIADIRNESVEDVCTYLYANAERVFLKSRLKGV